MSIENLTRVIQHRGLKVDCEAFTAAIEEGALAYATDTGEIGIYTNGTWEWIGAPALADHDHSGDAGDGGTFDATNLTSGVAPAGNVLTADGVGGNSYEPPAGGAALTVEEVDGAPTVANVTLIKVSNGTLTDDGGGVITINFGSAATDGAAIHDNVDGEINAITEKATPADADLILIEDSAASYAKKKVQVSNLPGGSATGFYGTQLLRTVVAAGGQASFDVTGIPNDLDVIKIFLQGKSEAAAIDAVLIALNNDTTNTNYYRTRIQGADTATTTTEAEDRALGHIGGTGDASYVGQIEVTIINPGGSLQKNVTSIATSRAAAAQLYVQMFCIEWENTAAINQITLTLDGGDEFAAGTFCTIIGYKNHV